MPGLAETRAAAGAVPAVPLAALAPVQGASWRRGLAASPEPSPSPWEVRDLALGFAPTPPPAALPPLPRGPGVPAPAVPPGEVTRCPVGWGWERAPLEMVPPHRRSRALVGSGTVGWRRDSSWHRATTLTHRPPPGIISWARTGSPGHLGATSSVLQQVTSEHLLGIQNLEGGGALGGPGAHCDQCWRCPLAPQPIAGSGSFPYLPLALGF